MRILLLALAVSGLAAEAAHGGAPAQQLPVVPNDAIQPADLVALGKRGAVGLVVPDAGPRTSRMRAHAALVRGEVRNSLHGELPDAPQLIATSDGAREPMIVLRLPSAGEQPNDERYAIAVVAPGYRGLLVSESTRVPGLVSIVDVAPTALGAAGALRSQAHDDPVAYLRDLDERIGDNGRARLPGALLATAIIALLALLLPTAAVLAFATLAAANLLLGAVGVSEPWLVVALLAAGTLAAVPLAFVLRSPLAIGLALTAVVAAYLVVLGVEGTWVSLSPLGPSQNGRFYGLSNLLETLLLVPAFAGAALLGRLLGWPAFAAVALLTLVTVAGSRFGADGGGAIVLAAGFAVLAVSLAGGGRRAIAAAGAAGAAAVAVVALDALLGPATHVGESLRDGEVFADLADRVILSWERATDSAVVAAVVAASILALATLVARGPRRPLPLALAAAIAVSLVVNDSPREVALGGLVAYLALLRGGQAPPPEYTHGAIVRGAER